MGGWPVYPISLSSPQNPTRALGKTTKHHRLRGLLIPSLASRFLAMSDASFSGIEPPSSPPRPQRPRRKRTHMAFHLDDNTLSDPPLFSSDPPDPSVDHYFQPRRKRQYKGTWWGPEPETTQSSGTEHMSKTEFARNLDSGVFMSDGTEESLLSDEPVPDPMEQEAIASYPRGLPPTRDYLIRPPTSSMSKAERTARHVVQQCLDDESEVVDLMYVFFPHESW